MKNQHVRAIGDESTRLRLVERADGYGVELLVKERRWLPVAREEDLPLFAVYNSPWRYGGAGIMNPHMDATSLRFRSSFRDWGGAPWEVRGTIRFQELGELKAFLWDIEFTYHGSRPTHILSCETWLKLVCRAQPFYMVPSRVYYAEGNTLNWFPPAGDDQFRVAMTPGIDTAYPFLYLWWQQRNCCLLLEKPTEKICSCLAMARCGNLFYAGVSFPHRGLWEFHTTGVLPLLVKPGQSFRLCYYLTAAHARKLHAYAPHLRSWYTAFSDHGDYARWANKRQGQRLLAQGFKRHYSPELKIVREVLHFSGKPAFPHRGMTVGWTAGATSAYAMLRLADILHDPVLGDASAAVLDNIAAARTPSGLSCSAYDEVDRRWTPGADWWARGEQGNVAGTPVSEGMFFLLQSYRWLKETRQRTRTKWLHCVLGNLDTLCRRNPDGVFGMFFDPVTGKKDLRETPWNRPWSFSMDWVACLALSARLVSRDGYLRMARKAARYYYDRIFSRGALLLDPIDGANSTVLDESGSHALRGFMELYNATGEDTWRRCAVDLAYYVVSYKFAWNVPVPRGTYLADNGFKSIGFSRHHYGLQNVPYLLDLWKLTGESLFLRTATDAVRSSLQPIVRRRGEQGGLPGFCCEGVLPLAETSFSVLGLGHSGTTQVDGQIRERISHAGDLHWMTYALLAIEDYGGVLVDMRRGDVCALDFLDVSRVRKREQGVEFTLANPWKETVQTRIGCCPDTTLPALQDGRPVRAGMIRLRPGTRSQIAVRCAPPPPSIARIRPSEA